MSKTVFVVANVLFRYMFPVYKFIYYRFKNKQDAFEISLLQRFIRPGNCVLDIGANVGFYAELISGQVGENGVVHAFEPDPVNFSHLQQSCGKKPNVRVHHLAVSSEPGELKLYTSNLLNVDHRTYPIDDYGKSFTVKAESIDHYLPDLHVDFIKMDIQGAEFFALNGMKETIEKNPEIKLLTEFWPYGLKEAGCSVELFEQFFKTRGFQFYLLQDEALKKLETLSDYTSRPEKEYFNLLVSRQEI